MKPQILTNLTPLRLEATLATLGQRPFRAKRLSRYVFAQGLNDFEKMSEIAKDLRSQLPQLFHIPQLVLAKRQKSPDRTEKFLFQLHDNRFIESVFIPDVGKKKGKGTLCLSSQAGCAMACTFCLTGFSGLLRHLETWEIVEQYRFILAAVDRPITHLVFMGMGEPLHNLENVLRAIEIFSSPSGAGLSERKITVSTSGLVPAMKKLSTRSKALLAISLNASNNAVRDAIMPINKTYPIEMLLGAIKDLPLKKKQNVFLEYVLIEGINDQPHHALELTKLLASVNNIKLNLIPYNPNPLSPYRRPKPEHVFAFLEILKQAKISVSIRQTRGDGDLAACGQLTGAVPVAAASETFRNNVTRSGISEVEKR